MNSGLVGYRRSGGTRTTAQELDDIFRALELNELLMPARILTGYIPGAEALRAVQNIVTQLKHSKPSITYLLDRAFSKILLCCFSVTDLICNVNSGNR